MGSSLDHSDFGIPTETQRRISYEQIIKVRKNSLVRKKSENLIDCLNLESKGVELSALIAESYKTTSLNAETVEKDSIGLPLRKHSLHGLLRKQSRDNRSNNKRSYLTASLEPNKLLEKAITEGYVDIVDGLVRSGQVNINKLNDQGYAPLHLAAFVGNAAVINKLLENGAFIDIRDCTGFSPLEIAVGEASFDCASTLIENGADQALVLEGSLIKSRCWSLNLNSENDLHT